jgi:hypothetical protein
LMMKNEGKEEVAYEELEEEVIWSNIHHIFIHSNHIEL